uniref:Uncharacterized protein n=1 Tax=Panagrolaimus sp. JU765 TaxID=591449 RepID=A0AC34RHL9_9BILA
MLKLLKPISKQFLSFAKFSTGNGKKFFPGRPVPFVTVQNLEREIIAKEIKTKKGDVPIKVVISRKEDFEPIMEFLLEDFCKGEPICQALRKFLFI